jgi:predicted ATPase
VIGGDDLFVGRVDELAVIAQAAARARDGAASTVFVAGAAGSGKSTLVRRAIAALTDFTLIRAQADELATHFAFDVVSQIQTPSATAPFAVGLDLLERLSTLQDDGPVLLVVEDLHWADNESRLALLTALRRVDPSDSPPPPTC